MMISFDVQECAGGREYKMLVSPLAREIIRAAVLVAGLLLILLIIYLVGGFSHDTI